MIRDGLLDGLEREFIMRRGGIWEEIQEIISEKQIDLVVIGTHGRRGIEKLLLGSVAERVFRHADRTHTWRTLLIGMELRPICLLRTSANRLSVHCRTLCHLLKQLKQNWFWCM